MQVLEKFIQAVIASLVSEFTLQWINPGHHCVCLFIGNTKSLVLSPYSRVREVYLHKYTELRKQMISKPKNQL